MSIHKKDGTILNFNNHGCIEVYSKKQRNNDREISKVKKAYNKGLISLELI